MALSSSGHGLCEFADNFTSPKGNVNLWIMAPYQKSPLLNLVAIGLKTAGVRFFICHVASRDHVAQGSYDFVVDCPIS